MKYGKHEIKLTGYSCLFDLHELSFQKPYHHPIALTTEQNDWSSQLEIYLENSKDLPHKTLATLVL